jgi:serine/threonine-protein kinase PknK
MERDTVVRVLGPIDVVTSSGVHPVGSRNVRAVLGGLVVAAGHAVSTALLSAIVWGDDPPNSAENSLQTYVSRIRGLLGHDAVVRADHSYRLAAERDQIDALRFEDLLIRATEARSDPVDCRPLCREALALWRGEPFGDLGEEEAFRLETLRLEELRLAAMELHLETDLELGRHEIIVAELESAVREYPYRERLWYLLAEALLRDDRRVEALRACTGLRDALATVGLDPGAELHQLESRILGVRPGTEAE